jgi:hypothetical protein
MIENGQLANSSKCQQFLATTTDAVGQFSFSGVRIAEHAELAYWGEKTAPGRQPVDVSARTDPHIQLELRAAAPACSDPIRSSDIDCGRSAPGSPATPSTTCLPAP